MMPMRPGVLLACESFAAGNGGIARVARLMAKVLAEEVAAGRLRAEVLALSDREPPQSPALPTRACAGSRGRFVLGVHAAARRSSHIIYDFAGVARAHPWIWPLRRPRLVCLHGIEVWESALPRHLASLRGAEMLLGFSRYSVDRATRAHPELARAQVCWLGTEHDSPPEPPRREGPPLALTVARLERGRPKGHDELIAAWPTVLASVPEARLAIVGRGPDEQRIRALALASPAAGSIDLLGFVSDDELERLYRRASLFAMPSRGEGFGLVYIEAMRHGLPVVASVHDAAQEINLDGVTGANVDLDQPGELADRLIGLLGDPARRLTMGTAAQERWSSHFRYARFRERFLPVLQSLLHR